MCDNIILKTVWTDRRLLEVRFTCNNRFVTATSDYYLTRDSLQCLRQKIGSFLREQQDEYWQSGEYGNQTTPCISFRFSNKDALGHVEIEIFMEIDDGGDLSRHTCCFSVETEIGLLQTFVSKLEIISESGIDYSVSLCPS